jgi:muramoyltetrapeptide carboxypeptidase
MKLAAPRRLGSLRKPPRLECGDTLALIAPSSPPLLPAVIDEAKEHFERLGYKVQVGQHARQRHGFLAGSDSDRAKDLNAAISSRSIRAILCIRGGYGLGRILGRIDFGKLACNPKIIVGCSDVTALLCGAAIFGKTRAFHGPMPSSLVDPECPEFTWNSFLGTLSGAPTSQGSLVSGHSDARSTVISIRRGRVTAPLIGGNLAVLCSLIGTPFFPSLANKILFFEDIGETPFRIDRNLTHLLSLGLLNSVAGFALGLFKDCAYRPPKPGETIEYRQDLKDVITERLRPLGKPIVMGLPFGHVPFNATVPLGALATLDGTKGDLIIEESSVI